jgi:mono/diheme cytochrome c family protein
MLLKAGILLVSASLAAAGVVSVTKNTETVNIPEKVTYAGHVAKIVNDHCINCHRPGDVAPFSLVGYDATKKQSANIISATESKRMPPWKAVAGFGEFKHENRLSESEIAILKRWNEQKSPRGDKSKEPPIPVFPTAEWALGKPDVVIAPSKPFKLEAEGEDVYRNFVFDLNLKEPVYVNAIDVKPSNKKVVHHIIAFLDAYGRSQKIADQNTDGQEGYTSSGGGIGTIPTGSLGGWAPGVRADYTEPGTGFLLKPGTKIVMQVHYHKSGKAETDQTKLGLYFAKKPVTKPLEIFWMANPAFRLPAGANNHRVAWNVPVPVDSTVYYVMPHMHLLGKSMQARVKFPDGSTKPLVFVDKWDFNWQLIYTLKEPMFLPAGSKVSVEAFYDNSSANTNNPSDPPVAVTWGEQTTDEMALLVVGYSKGKP